jgi:drug/metabolite transporter (DMT)-like permease
MITVRRPAGAALMVAAAASWGLSAVLAKVSLQQLAPLDLFGIELTAGAALIWGGLLSRGLRGLPAGWRTFAVLGAVEPALAYSLFNLGLSRTSAADGAILLATESLFTVLLGRLVLGERMSGRAAAAVPLGFAGAVVVALGTNGHAGSWLGDALVVGGAACAAGYNVGARKFTRGTGSIEVTAVQLLAAAVVSVPILLGGAVAGHSHLGHVNAAHLVAAVATGVLGTAVPFMLFNAAIGQMQVSRVAVMLNLIPVFGVTLAVLLLGERLGLPQLAGAVLVLLAVMGAREQDGSDLPPTAPEPSPAI